MTSQIPTPIAVVGVGCRFPGGANSPQKLWQMLSEGRSGWSEVPPDRWNSNSFHHPDAEAKDGFDVHGGHFMDQDISVFEPGFFGISGNEAESMDPQQRILLETTYEALENAGIPQEKIRGSDTGVYVGYFARNYDRMVFKDTSDLPKQHITGGGDAIVSNRMSYVFDLKEPSMTIDTGCSGSLVALHLACQSLRAVESTMSTVGGVNLHLSPNYDVTMSFVNVLNKDGKCYAFDSRGSGQGNYAAGCAYEDALANSQIESNTHFMSLNLGLVEGSDIDTPERRAYLLAQGAAPVQMNELFSLLEYSLSSDSLSKLLGKLLKFPMLNHLHQVAGSKDPRPSNAVSVDVAGAIGSTLNMDEIHVITSKAIVTKISSLVALEAGDISMDVTMAEFGLDSLVAIELKNWIVRNLQAQIRTIEILDMPSIRQLATTVIERSTLIRKSVQGVPAKVQHEAVEAVNTNASEISHSTSCCHAAKEVRKLPLHGLEQILQSYLLGIRNLVTEEEYSSSVKATEEFRQPGSMKDEPTVENWMEDLYLQSMYLSRRSPTALYYDIMGTFGAVTIPHAQAERAAVISVIAFKFKQDLEASAVSPVYFNEIQLCMDSQNWLFNATRVPLPGSDEVVKYTGPEYEYLIVLRLGHFFKVPLTGGNGNVSIEQLRSSFQSILDLELEDSWVGILTADERDSWALIRNKLVSLDPSNQEAIRVIDGACFLVCLDAILPTTPEDRIRDFMMNRGINRWHDKSLQFLVASNASTAFIGDHTKLDGGSVHQLLGSVKKAIAAHPPAEALAENLSLRPEEVVFKTSPDVELEITRMRKTWLGQCTDIDYANLEYAEFGATYLKNRRCNPQSGFEVVAQLASRMMFGHFEACWQPVNMAHYHKGRTEIIQTMTSPMITFINLALQPSPPIPAVKKSFFEATREHSSSMTLAQKGLGYHRTLTAMEMLTKQQGGEVLSLYSDPAWCKTGPENIMTGPRDGLFSEVASVWPKKSSLFVNYEVGEDGARFSVVGHGGRAQEYCKLLEKAAGIVKAILDDE
ncbi:ketoacyl-synt-domain-containing protein [Acephala macrosclerotiorum]|nr:ketoacyl-synt-domain-containing protein [Acephala macrosclerotiorum]